MEESRRNSANLYKNPCVGILREVKYVWERRVAITPSGCKSLIDMGIKIKVQPSKIRCFSDDEYVEVGAEISEDLSDCNLIVGLQDPEINLLLPDRTYSFFSHTKKGKVENQGLIEKIS
jgi:alpha-aminoadipic semialdehyde synthase